MNLKDTRVGNRVPAERLSKLDPSAKFTVDADAGKISLSLSGGPVEVGEKILYTDINHPLIN